LSISSPDMAIFPGACKPSLVAAGQLQLR